MISPLSEADIIALVKEEMNKLDDVRLFYTCRQFNVKQKQLKYVRCLLALDELGLPINSLWVHDILQTDYRSALVSLHNLGDKHVIVLKRKKGRQLEWVLHPFFKKTAMGLCCEKVD
ncbi:MAG: hypothetical protein ACOWW1_10275 [archaeon]